MNEPGLSFPESIFWLTILTPLAAGLGLGGVAGIGALLGIGIPFLPLLLITTVVAFFVQFIKIKLTLEETTDVDNLKRYFDLAIADQDVKRITVRGFRQEAPDHGVQHCKMMIVDDKRAVVLGSPFSQRYFDSLVHPIENPKRGYNTSDMVHDVRMAVVGPATRDLFETFRLYWNEDIPESEELPALPDGLDPNAQTSGEGRYRQSAGYAHTQRQAILRAGRREREGNPGGIPAGVRRGKALHLLGDAVLH